MQNGGTLNMHPPQLCSPWPILPSLTQYKTAISVPLILMALLCWLSLQPEAMTSRNGCTEQKNSQQQQHIRPGMSTLPSIATSIPSGLFFSSQNAQECSSSISQVDAIAARCSCPPARIQQGRASCLENGSTRLANCKWARRQFVDIRFPNFSPFS